MSTGVLDRNAYTIGWICALSVESAAAQVFLDERHQVPSDVSDSNSYVAGRIGKHNVVIAVMPQNEYGTATAATTAKDMVRSFPQVRLGLMVGIGGGAPSQEHDIRLGDVVVSSRGKGVGGVIQFDYGKTIQDQDFKETGHLNQPPTALMTAVAALEAQYDLEGPQLDEKVGEALRNQRKAFKKKYARPSEDTDRLYRPEVTHPSDLSGDCPTTCGVKSDDLVHRLPRSDEEDNPNVHYGLIASSNQVMKDALKRDKLVRRGVLCFEMEAAGLMNHFPCLVIRGICDYADTHKNSSWQPYAAMVAAAYAKDLLGLVNVTAVEGEKKVGELLASVASMQREQNEALKHTITAVEEMGSRQRITSMKEWLGPAEPSDNAKRAKDLRYEETGTWFLTSSVFKDWLKDDHRHLCLYGEVGCGKTVLASTILDYLRENRNGATLYFFFDFNDAQKRTIDGLIRSLLFQLYTAEGDGAQKVDDLRKSHDGGKGSPSTTKLSKCFQDALATFKEAVILMDALDECDEENNEQGKLIKWIVDIGSIPSLERVKIITTARPEAAFKKWLDPRLANTNCVELAKDAIKADIESYVKGCLKHRPGFHTQAPDHPIVKQIPERLIQKADGMFRYAACQIDDIVSCFGPEEIEDILDSLPETIQETYKRSIERIPHKHKVKAIRILQFLINLDKPLELAEAVDIVTVRSDFRPFSAADRICPQDIVRLCPNLLSIMHVERYIYMYGTYKWVTRSELHLAHLSVKEYLVQLNDPGFTFTGVDASISIARTCLSYLLAIPAGNQLPDDLDDRYDQNHDQMTGEQWTSGRNGFPLEESAFHMLERHYVAAEGSPKAVYAMAGQLQTGLKECPFAPPQWEKAKRYSVNPYESCLHFACYLGLLETVKSLAARGVDVNYRTESSLSPIGVAVRMNRVEIVRFLLDFGVSPNTTHSQSLYGSILRCSCKFSLHEITRLLARKGADLNRLEGDENRRERPLHIAIEQVDVKLVRLLLDEGADANADGGYLGIILQEEAGSGFECDEHEGDSFGTSFGTSEARRYERSTRRYGFRANLHQIRDYVDIVATLLDRGADSNARCGSFGTVLQAAARSGVYDFVWVLLQHGANVNAKGAANGHALQVAVELGHVHIVGLLLDWGADSNAPSGTSDGNALQTAFRLYNESVIAVLLNRGAYVNTESNGYRHALEAAAWKGNVGMVKLLLEKGAHSGNQSIACGPALKAAIEIGDKYIMGLLLDRGAHFDTEDNVYGHALKAAAKKGYKDVVKFLLGTGANFDTEGSVYVSALKAAVQEGHEEVVGLLLEGGTHSDIEGNPVYGYALRAAVKEGHEAIVGILLKRGENADVEGENYDPYHSALKVAAKEGYKDIVKIFLNKGADTSGRSLEIALYVAATRGNRDLFELLLESGANVNTQGGSLENALRAAITGDHHGLVEILLQRGADINASQGQLGNFLAMACTRESPQVMRYLLRYGANANTSVPGFGSVLYHTLYVLIKRHILWGDKQRLILQILLEAGAEIQSSTSPGYNSLRFAVERGASEPVRLLLNYGADPNILYDASQYHSNHTLLMECLVKSQPGIAQELLQFGADPNGKTSRRLPGQTALHLAMNEGFEEIVRLLLQKGADPDLQSGLPPYTPLQLAVKRGSMKYVRLFLEHGADVEMKGGLGKNITALKLAEKAGNAEIIQLLQQASTQKMSENS